MKWKRKKTKPMLVAVTALATLILCPAITYGASAEILKLQNKAASVVMAVTGEELEMPQFVYEEYQEQSSLEAFMEIESIVLKPRGGTDIEVTLSAGETKYFTFMQFEKGTKVSLYLTGNTSDTFKGGLIDKNNVLRGVTSQNGMIQYTFTIDEAKEYAVYIQNTGSSVLHVRGSVYI